MIKPITQMTTDELAQFVQERVFSRESQRKRESVTVKKLAEEAGLSVDETIKIVLDLFGSKLIS